MPERRYSLLIVSSEFSPLAKTGGLGDVVADLAKGLRRRGHDVRVVLPLYRRIRQAGLTLDTALPALCVTMGAGEVWCAVRRVETADAIPLFLIEHEEFFNRSGLYNDERYQDYPDNVRRFGFFCRAALQLALELNLAPDIVQAHDWQTALAPAYLKAWFPHHPRLGRCASLLTIHNESYPGLFAADHYAWLGLRPQDFNREVFEDYGRINLLKGGIYFADAVNTVSPRHAEEMRAPFGAFGLAPAVANKGAFFRGILNGVDYNTWSPEKDPFIPARYSVTDMSGKAVCKRELQRQFNLGECADRALIAFIGRLTLQKGVHLLREFVERHLAGLDLQLVVLGSGAPEFERYFSSLPARFPGRVGTFIGYHESLAHAIEAGADFFVMPSLYEPCGLNQMYSLRYGTIPIVHATGGLDDTVEDYDESTGAGTGIKFREPAAESLRRAIDRALALYDRRPDHLRMMIGKAMRQEFSWERAVRAYEDLFALALEAKNVAARPPG